jgi:hypothetical protein
MSDATKYAEVRDAASPPIPLNTGEVKAAASNSNQSSASKKRVSFLSEMGGAVNEEVHQEFRQDNSSVVRSLPATGEAADSSISETSDATRESSLVGTAASMVVEAAPPKCSFSESACLNASGSGNYAFRAFTAFVLFFSLLFSCFHVHLILEAAATITVTFDETAHVGAGVTFWKYKDFRLNPENGVLPQLIAGAGIMLGRPGVQYTIPSYKQQAWRYSDCWSIGFQLLHESGNVLQDILHDGRRGIAVRDP